MKNDKRMRFTIAVRHLGANQTHDEVYKVQQFLGRFGYLKERFEPKKLDQPTQHALKVYQARVGIEASGVIDEPTAQTLEQPRCGVPDFSRGDAFARVGDPFVLRGCSYKGIASPVKYALSTPPQSFTLADLQPAIKAAIDTWKNEIPISFQEVSLSDDPVLTFEWVEREHGDGEPFDGVGHVLAHAFSPPKCGGTHTGKCHFDNQEVWDFFHGAGIHDIQTVALHEIGHLLGLDHSAEETSVMFEYYKGTRRELTTGDISAIQTLYSP